MEFRLAGKVRVGLWFATVEFRLAIFLVDTPYKQQYRYLPEFEQAYRIFEEEGAGGNSIQIADTMVALERYKVASKHDPEELHPFKTSIETQPQQHGQIINPQNRRSDRKTYRRRIT